MAETNPVPPPAQKPEEADIHGKKRMGQNILSNWAAQAVTMVSGFVVPRLIDRGLGQEALGIWDFAWSIVVYFNMVQMGVTGSINRYVAFNRVKEDYDAISRAVSSVAMIMRSLSVGVTLITLAIVWGVGHFLSQRFGSHVDEAQWLVFLLGLGMAIQISATIYQGVLTGCHQWKIHNGITAVTNITTMVGMISVLLAGQGLIALALVTFISETIGRGARVYFVKRTCPWLQIKLKLFKKETAREMISFGGKTFAATMSQMIMDSTIRIMIASSLHLGPASLALYGRPMALVRSMGTFVNKYAMVFSPMISSLHGAGQIEEVRNLALKSTRYGLFISLPISLFLMFFGGEILYVWMGARYVNPLLIALLVAAYFHQITYIPLFKALVGLNLHGRPGMMIVIGSALGILLAYLSLAVFKGPLEWVAISVAIPMTLVHGVFLPLYACRKLEMPLKRFWEEVWRQPTLSAIPSLIFFAFGRFYFSSMVTEVAVGAGLGFGALAVCYWRSVLPARWKRRFGFART